MKKLLIGLTLVTSLSAFADVYNGIDNTGSPCELRISALESNPERLLVQVKTKKIHATSYDYRASIKNDVIDVKHTFTQGDFEFLLTTTDRIVVKLDGSTPLQYSVKRNKKLKGYGFLGSKKESLPEVICTLNN